eukprot:SAG31_NODE_664_length_12996_cov_4.853997_4_plen_75_part_00
MEAILAHSPVQAGLKVESSSIDRNGWLMTHVTVIIQDNNALGLFAGLRPIDLSNNHSIAMFSRGALVELYSRMY